VFFFFQLKSIDSAFGVIVEEEDLFFVASSSLDNLFTGRTTTAKKHVLLFFQFG
jgi:hypothetical protein